MRFLVVSAPRSGSSLFEELLSCHHEVSIVGEIQYPGNNTALLNGTTDLEKLATLDTLFARTKKRVSGFKVFFEQMHAWNLSLEQIVRHVRAQHVIVLYRENVVESIVSKSIAQKTQLWYSKKPPAQVETVTIEPCTIREAIAKKIKEWQALGAQWPMETPPIFVKYEDLVSNIPKEMAKVFRALSLELGEFDFAIKICRQNPASLEEKLTNWKELPEDLQTATIDVPSILRVSLMKRLCIPDEIQNLIPSPEPAQPAAGWAYRVAEPFLPNQAKINVVEALESNSVSSAGMWPGKFSQSLKRYFDVPVAQPCSSGFASLMLALQCCNVGPGDEVIMPTLNMIAVSNAVIFLGATPVFVDCAVNDYNPSWKEISEAASPKTKAVIVVHVYGVPTKGMSLIAMKCKARGWSLIEDISECTGVKTCDSNGMPKLLGTFGDFGCGSLYANKIIQAGDGGFVLAKDVQVSSRLASLTNHGFTKTFHFLHMEPAINGKINGLGAAMADGCLAHLDMVLEHRSLLAKTYRANLKNLEGLTLMPEAGVGDTPWVFGLKCESSSQRDQLRQMLAEQSVETRNFFAPLHIQPAYGSLDVAKNRLCRSEVLGSTGFYLPTYPSLTTRDVEYISSVIQHFFHGSATQAIPIERMPDRKAFHGVHIDPESLTIEAKMFDRNGEALAADPFDNPLVEAVKLCSRFEEALVKENWGNCTDLLEEADDLLDNVETKLYPEISVALEPFIRYFGAQQDHDSATHAPWLNCSLYEKIKMQCQHIPTTTDDETCQLLVWLILTRKSKKIIEIGSWFGYSTLLMTLAALECHKQPQVVALDPFAWQEWMHEFAYRFLSPGDSFLPEFKRNVGEFLQHMTVVEWSSDNGCIPKTIQTGTADLLFLDFTQDAQEMETVWQKLNPFLRSGHTLVVINSITKTMLPFLENHAAELKPIAKPFAKAKAYLFTNGMAQEIPVVKRSLKFAKDQDWAHHHLNGFNANISLLHEELHSDAASCLFISAVEDYLCEHPIPATTDPWIGIVHSPPENHLFYVPDLHRLCTYNKYKHWLRLCKGIFTLTTTQAEFLKANLPVEFKFPIVPITLPTIAPKSIVEYQGLQKWKETGRIDLVHIGGYARDLDYFTGVKVPKGITKIILVGDPEMKDHVDKIIEEPNLRIECRADEEKYEIILASSLPILCLQYEGAANTVVVECITRGVPIIAPKIQSVMDYLGENYPLYYQQGQPDLSNLITVANVQTAAEYLKTLDKSCITSDYFIKSIKQSAAFLATQPVQTDNVGIDMYTLQETMRNNFEVTVVICSYKRTHHLEGILDQLWNGQSFQGSYQIILWNNNTQRSGTVNGVSEKYIRVNTSVKSLEVIHSSHNHYCAMRLALPVLMRSPRLLICDDDIVPGRDFIRFFMDGNQTHPDDILCVRGHYFLPHELDMNNPAQAWEDYEFIRFADDTDPEQFIHYVHADACMIPKTVLMECASVEMPDPEFKIVDDYWLSYVANGKFGHELRKLQMDSFETGSVLTRTDDSDQPEIALHKNPLTEDAKIRMYIHHMINDWPFNLKTTKQEAQSQLPTPAGNIPDWASWKQQKQDHWNHRFVGFNINSQLTDEDIEDLGNIGVKYVRIGAVGVKEDIEYELSPLKSNPKQEIPRLRLLIQKLQEKDINTVFTLESELAIPDIWRKVAEAFSTCPSVIGYDLVNEPFTARDDDIHWTEIGLQEDTGIKTLEDKYQQIIDAIREVDGATPIIIEPTFWGHHKALEYLDVERIKKMDTNILLSIHYYEPHILTNRFQNQGRFSYPGKIAVHDVEKSELQDFGQMELTESIKRSVDLAESFGVKLFIGELGIGREVKGAKKYLKHAMNACGMLGIGCFLYAFRDICYDAFDYELGPDPLVGSRKQKQAVNNVLIEEIQNQI